MIDPSDFDRLARLAAPADRDIAAAVIVAPDGRYLLQLRDDLDWLPLAGHWTCFGGGLEPGETAEAALRREIAEELSWPPCEIEPVTVLMYAVWPQRRVVRLHYFAVPASEADLAAMVQREGAAKALFTLAEAAALDKVGPWDLCALMIHARHTALFRPGDRYEP